MNRIPRAERLPLSSRQSVRLVTEAPQVRTVALGQQQQQQHDEDEYGVCSHFQFESSVLPAVWKAGSSSKSRAIHNRAGAEFPVTDDDATARRLGQKRKTNKQGWTNFPLVPTSDPLLLIPPTHAPITPAPEALRSPFKQLAPHINIEHNLEEFRRIHPHLLEQITDPILLEVLKDEERLFQGERSRLRDAGDLGPEGVEEMRDEPVLPTGPTMTAVWDQDRESVLVFLVGDEDSNMIYLHEIKRAPHVGIIRSIHAQPIFSSPIPILQIGVSARTRDPKALPLLLLFIRTATTTSVWNVQKGREADLLAVSMLPNKARVEKRKRSGSRRERTKGQHPYTLMRIADLPTYADERPTAAARATAPTEDGVSEVAEQDEDDEGVHDGGSEEDETWSPRIPSKAKGKGRAIQRVTYDQEEVAAAAERHEDDMDVDQDDATLNAEGQRSAPTASSSARKQQSPIVDAAWHPSDPNRLLTVDAVGRLGIWVYDPGIFKSTHRLISEAIDPDVRFPAFSGPVKLENKAAFFQVKWAERAHIAFSISRTQLRVINVETGASMQIMDARMLPQMSSLMSRPQFVRMLPSHIDELNFGSASNGKSVRPSLLAVLTTVEVLFWETAALERFLTGGDEPEKRPAPPEDTPTRRSSRIDARQRFRTPGPDETAPAETALNRNRNGKKAAKTPPIPVLRWEHLRGQDRSLNLNWIPFKPKADYHALVVSSARSRVALIYPIRIEQSAQKRQFKDGHDMSVDLSHGSESDDIPPQSASLFQPIKFRGLAPTLLPTGIPARLGWEVKQPLGPIPFPRSCNAPVFVRFDLPSVKEDEDEASPDHRATDGWEDVQDDDSEAEVQDLTATAAPRRRPGDQVVMLEQDSRCGVIGTICEITTDVTSLQTQNVDDDQDLSDEDEDAVQSVPESTQDSIRGRRGASRRATRANTKVNILLSQYRPRAPKHERFRFAPDRLQQLYHEEQQKAVHRMDRRAEDISEGWRNLVKLNSNRRKVDKDGQRDRQVVDLRVLYKVLMQISTVSQGEDVPAVESMLERGIQGIQAGELMSSVPQLPQLLLALAYAEDPIAGIFLDYASPALSATLAIPITLLLQFPTTHAVIDKMFAAFSEDCFVLRPFRPHDAITADKSLGDHIRDDVQEQEPPIETVSLHTFEDLAARIKQMYIGPQYRIGHESTGVLGAASDQLAFDLLLSSVAISSQQINIVVGASSRSVEQSADETFTVNNHLVGNDHAQDARRSGAEEVLRAIARAAGDPRDRLAEADEESDAGAEVGSQGAGQHGQSQSQRHGTGSQSRSQSQSRGGIRSSQASASARSSRVEELEDRIDRHFDALELEHLPEIYFPFLRPYLRPPDEPHGNTQASGKQNKKKMQKSKIAADPEWIPVSSTSRAARLLLSDWTIGEKVDAQAYGDPYALPGFDDLAEERQREARWRRDTSVGPQAPPIDPSTPGRMRQSQMSRPLDASIPSQPIERWRTSIAAAGPSRPAFTDIPPMTPGLHQSGMFSPRLGFDFGIGPPQIGARSSLGVLSSPPAASQPATRNERRTGGMSGAAASHSQGQGLLRAGGTQQLLAAHASASLSSQQANQHEAGAMLGSSQQDASDAGMASTQPLPGRFADRKAGAIPISMRKKAKKKRAGGF